jgi:hypothetical protein
MSLFRTDAWYKVSGEDLVMIRYGLYSLERDVKANHLTTEAVAERLAVIREMLPDDPPVINDPPV